MLCFIKIPNVKIPSVFYANKFSFLCLLFQGQDPQELAAVACESSTSIFELTDSEGYIESLNYPENYNMFEECQWYINPSDEIPAGQVSRSVLYSHMNNLGRKILKSSIINLDVDLIY